MPTFSDPPARNHSPGVPGSKLTTIAMFVVVTGILYFARDVLIPFALSVLLAFLLAPAVRRLERAGLPRVAATTLIVGLSCAVIAGLVWISVNQFLNFAARLPEYKDNIQEKLSVLRTDPDGSLSRARRTLEELSAEMAKEEAADAAAAAKAAARAGSAAERLRARTATPVEVNVVAAPLTPMQFLRELITPLIVPLTVAGAVIVFTFIMLLRREDLRDRLIRLVGQGKLNVTTQVFEEAANLVSRYLRVQLIVNVTYGVPVGVALYAIGLPNAALWGLLAIALRFIPYIGAWIAAAFPIALAFAISDGWTLVLWTVTIFLVLELISNNVVEPWAYGASTGMSALAVMAAAIFWTWLWGAVGLLLAVPLTVCLVVMGRYVPQLAFLSILLGDQPVLSMHDRIYQRLLAHDQEEAVDLVEQFAGEHGIEALYEEVLVPVLESTERDRERNMLAQDRARFVFDSVRALVDEAAESAAAENKISDPERAARAESDSSGITVCVAPAQDEADEIAGAMLVQRLHTRRVNAELLAHDLLKSEVLEKVIALNAQAIYISALPPGAVIHATLLCKRLRTRLPDLKIVVALWHTHTPHGMQRLRDRLLAAGANEIVTTLKSAVEKLPAAALVEAMRVTEVGSSATTSPGAASV